MNLSTIIFGADFSDLCEPGLQYAAHLAQLSAARLLIVHVAQPQHSGERQIYSGLPQEQPIEEQHALEKLLPANPAVAFEHRFLHGDPGRELVRIADSEGAGLIVVGTHGRRGFRRFMVGSVAEEVVRTAHCPVLVYRQSQ